MSRLLVLTTRELAVGYRLAGSATLEVGSPVEAHDRLQELLVHERGVIAVHAPYFYELDPPLRRLLDSTDDPLVIPLPAGMAAEEVSDRRDRLLQILRRVLGYEITFGEERGTP
jgi:vacuolar-type H+-ATPase subunit F/Vma7